LKEIDRIDGFWKNRTPMIISDGALGALGLACALGLIPVVRPVDYDAWWEEIGKQLGAPARSDIHPTTQDHQVGFRTDGSVSLIPIT